MSVGIKKYQSVKGRLTGDPHIDNFLANAEIYKNVKNIKFGFSQLTTGSAVEIAQKTGTAITLIGRTELTLVGAFSADDNYYDGSYVRISYKDNLGVLHYALMATNTTSTAEVAFTEYDSIYATSIAAVTDGYSIESIGVYTDITCSTLLPLQAGETFGVGSTGVLTLGTVAAETSEATQATLFGVGAVYGRYHTNAGGYDGAVQYMEYCTPWGEIKWAHCSTQATTSTTEIRFFESTAVSRLGVVTAGAVTVKDFYRLRTLYTTITPAAGHTFLLTDAACANVDGSGNDVYGMIEEAYYYSIHSSYYCPLQHNAILHMMDVMGPASATNWGIIAVTGTVIGQLQPTTLYFTVAAGEAVPHMEFNMEPDSDLSFTIIDGAAAFTADTYIKIAEAENVNAEYGVAA